MSPKKEICSLPAPRPLESLYSYLRGSGTSSNFDDTVSVSFPINMFPKSQLSHVTFRELHEPPPEQRRPVRICYLNSNAFAGQLNLREFTPLLRLALSLEALLMLHGKRPAAARPGGRNKYGSERSYDDGRTLKVNYIMQTVHRSK